MCYIDTEIKQKVGHGGQWYRRVRSSETSLNCRKPCVRQTKWTYGAFNTITSVTTQQLLPTSLASQVLVLPARRKIWFVRVSLTVQGTHGWLVC